MFLCLFLEVSWFKLLHLGLSGFPVVLCHTFSCSFVVLDLSRESSKVAHSTEKSACSSRFSFPTGGTRRFRGDLSMWYCAGVGEGQFSPCVATFFILLMKSVFVSVCRESVLSTSPLYSKILLVVSCSQIDISVLLVKGNKVKNNLRCHLGDVTLQMFFH